MISMRKENSTNSLNEKSLQAFCNVHRVLSQISGRWKVSLILALQYENLKYSSFKSILPDVSDRILAKQLKELEDASIIYNEKDKTQSLYILTEKGKKIVTVLITLGNIDKN